MAHEKRSRNEKRPDPAEPTNLKATRFLRHVIDAVPNFIFIKDWNGTFVFANKAVAGVYGTTPEALVGKSDADFCADPDQLEFFLQADRRVLAERNALHISEEQITDSTGGLRWLQTIKMPITTPDGDERNVLGICTDITERRDAEQRAKLAAEEFEKLYDCAPCGYLSLNPKGIITRINQTVLDWLGYTRREVVRQKTLYELFADHCKLAFEQCFPDFVKSGDKVTHEGELVAKSGITIPVMMHAVAVRDEQGNFLYSRCTAFDISERKKFESQLLAAKEEAERANQAKSEFLSRMSHELRTPLNSVLGFAQVLELEGLRESQAECVAQIVRGGRHLLDMINEILDISRIESGHMALSLEAVEVQEVIEEATALMGPVALAKGVSIQEQYADGSTLVHADRQRLLQILLNLLSNGIKYNVPGGSVWVNVKGPKDRIVEISVADSGSGIDPGQATTLFEPFARLGAERTSIEGTGLGLALSKRLAEAMGGYLSYSPGGGSGSIFSLNLCEAEPQVLSASSLDLINPVKLIRQPEGTVLLIEDNPNNIELMKRMLAMRPNLRLIVAMQGSLGLELAKQHHPELILLDLNLPDVFGNVLLRELRSAVETRDLPVIVTSADATPRQIDRIMGDGATGYLTKPIDIARLLAVVDGILGEVKLSA